MLFVMIIPVLDIKDGVAVSGKSGKRETYKPLKTIFCKSSNPYEIAKSLKAAGALRIYIADLDAIDRTGSNFGIVDKINKKIPVMLDAGASSIRDVTEHLKIADKVIIATETLKNIKDLDGIFGTLDRDNIILSVDIMDNKIFSKHANFDFKKLISKIDEISPQEIIILDISRVGTEKGVNLELIEKFMRLRTSIIIGGGITRRDVKILDEFGVDKFLVGSALHRGELPINL